ncbi:hypothetical protein [Candidatus Hodarchaeum mangrovi]
MDLSTKYLIGFLIILTLSLVTSFPILVLLFNSSVLLDIFVNPWTTIILGVIISSVGIFYYILLFSPERIKGIRGTYEASPDLSTFRIVEMKGQSIKTTEIPNMAFCSVCGKQIFKPYLCSRCGQLLCAQHYSYGNHQCLE